MKVKVSKFGGTSMATAENIKKAIEIIHKDEKRRLIILSAPGKRFEGDIKITDLLYKVHGNLGSSCFRDILNEVKERFESIVQGLEIDFDLQSEFAVIEKESLESRSEDYLASRGEYLMARILAAKLGFEFIDAASLFKFQCERRFDGPATREVIAKTLTIDRKAVIPGFYGADEDGRIVTFSRGGSDFSGAVIAGTVRAEVYENFTDVDGVFMCNPKIVKNPKKLSSMTYEELRELSYMGASVLHEDCVFPTRDSGTKIHILNTFNENSLGTFISSKGFKGKTVTGISGIKELFQIIVTKKRQIGKASLIARTMEVLERHKIRPEFVLTGIDKCGFIVRPFEEELKPLIVAELRAETGVDEAFVHGNIGAIVIIGGDFERCPSVFERVFGALCESRIRLQFMNFSKSGKNVFIGVESKDFDKAIRKLYRNFKDD